MDMSPTDQVGINIRVAMVRRQPRTNQAMLAAAVGISQSQLSKRLRGVIPLDINELVAIAHFLDIPLDTLTEGAADLAEAAS